MDSRVRLLCYPRGSFYPLSSVPPMKDRRITKTDFRPCSCRHSRSQAGLCLYTFGTVSIRAKPTLVPLRYSLARYRPSKTAHLALSFSESASELSEFCHVPKGGVSRSLEQSSRLTNPKSKIRNPKQITNQKFQIPNKNYLNWIIRKFVFGNCLEIRN